MVEIEMTPQFGATAACLLLTPYANENLEHHLPHPLRARTLAWLEPHREHACAKLFRELVAQGAFGSYFYASAAWMTPSAPFQWIRPASEIDLPEAIMGGSYLSLLTSFLEEAKLLQLWESVAPQRAAVAQQCREALRRYRVEEWLASFWGAPPRRLVLVPNPTDPPDFGFGPSSAAGAFAIVGPPAVPKDTPEESRETRFRYDVDDAVADLAVHEFGHAYLHAVRNSISTVADKHAEVGRSLPLQDWFPRRYSRWSLQLEEIMLRAAQATWRAETISRSSAHEYVTRESERFGLTVLPSIYCALLDKRQRGALLGPEGVLQTVAEALTRFSPPSPPGGTSSALRAVPRRPDTAPRSRMRFRILPTSAGETQ